MKKEIQRMRGKRRLMKLIGFMLLTVIWMGVAGNKVQAKEAEI